MSTKKTRAAAAAAAALPVTDAVTAAVVTTTGGPSPYTAPNVFSGDLLGLPIPEEEQALWELTPMTPSMGSTGWDLKADAAAFANSALERDLKNAQVRNGQPTPPPYDDQTSGMSGMSTLIATTGAIKRCRAREAKTAAASLSPDLDDDDDDDCPQQDRAKRAKFLERNRLAASKCRQKKKEHTQLLEQRYKEQSDMKENLQREVQKLKAQVLSLKNELLCHAQCNDEAIKLHLTQMVKDITVKDTDARPPVPGDPTANLPDHTTITTTTSANPIPPSEPDVPSTQHPVSSIAATTAAATTAAPAPTTLSFGFDDPLQLEPAAAAAAAEAFEQQLRRDSETSFDTSYTFISADETFDELINM